MNPVLWVEDSDDQRYLMEIAAEGTGFAGAYDIAVTVQEAIVAIEKRAASGHPYERVACDLQLPGGSGWDVHEAVVATGHGPVSFVMVSASNDPRDRMAAEDAGCHFVVKPSGLDGWIELAEMLAPDGGGEAGG